MTQAVMTGLVEGDPYFIRYTAVNIHGQSEPSIVFYTLMATAPDQISAPVTVNDDINVVITWSATTNERGSSVTAYRIKILSKNAVGIE